MVPEITDLAGYIINYTSVQIRLTHAEAKALSELRENSELANYGHYKTVLYQGQILTGLNDSKNYDALPQSLVNKSLRHSRHLISLIMRLELQKEIDALDEKAIDEMTPAITQKTAVILREDPNRLDKIKTNANLYIATGLVAGCMEKVFERVRRDVGGYRNSPATRKNRAIGIVDAYQQGVETFLFQTFFSVFPNSLQPATPEYLAAVLRDGRKEFEEVMPQHKLRCPAHEMLAESVFSKDERLAAIIKVMNKLGPMRGEAITRNFVSQFNN